MVGFFESKKEEEEIASTILEKEDRLEFLFKIMGELPSELVGWFISRLSTISSSSGYAEIDFVKTVDMGWNAFPGDLVIKKNRDPKVNDIVEIVVKGEKDYVVLTTKVLKINIKEGTLFVVNNVDSDSKGNISVANVMRIIDKVIPYNSSEWKKLVNIFELDYSTDEFEEWTKESIESVKKSENFYQKENTLKKLEDRLKEVKKK